jgi:hypothetical protein
MFFETDIVGDWSIFWWQSETNGKTHSQSFSVLKLLLCCLVFECLKVKSNLSSRKRVNQLRRQRSQLIRYRLYRLRYRYRCRNGGIQRNPFDEPNHNFTIFATACWSNIMDHWSQKKPPAQERRRWSHEWVAMGFSTAWITVENSFRCPARTTARYHHWRQQRYSVGRMFDNQWTQVLYEVLERVPFQLLQFEPRPRSHSHVRPWQGTWC